MSFPVCIKCYELKPENSATVPKGIPSDKSGLAVENSALAKILMLGLPMLGKFWQKQ